MDRSRVMAGGLAVNRMGFGLRYLLRPESAGPSWIGRDARKPSTKVMTRSQAVRDIALGAGALLALARGAPHEARIWLGGHAVADATDFLVTWHAREKLPRRGVRLALTVAGISTAVAATAAYGLRPPTAARRPADTTGGR